MKRFLLTTAVLLAASIAQADPASVTDTAKGPTLVNSAGMTLYTFAKDSEGMSACNGPCATNWPPLMASAEDQAMGDWSVITRDDGTKQWAYKGQPLYTWKNDMKPGDVTGDGVANGAWKVAQP
ncbi:hypothetical protein [Thioclava sp. JE_KL1]|uniref:COG4315 family predicted lipoprotein n=1 Tax=Thioclava sp. JE_KL1 TaxID=2651187 RepID=UPI00128B9DF0|nr:hypothetical protein [Thioclava sp. JE_KL1]MPQ93269.1 hypothetical protein [Thioclava sp. JE_KL1]